MPTERKLLDLLPEDRQSTSTQVSMKSIGADARGLINYLRHMRRPQLTAARSFHVLPAAASRLGWAGAKFNVSC